MAISARTFDGINGPGLPDPDLDFSLKSAPPTVEPEVVVDVKQDDDWVRIPVTGVEQWVDKDGPADMSRTAKVTFPMEWGGQSIAQYVNGFSSNNNLAEQNDPYDECRIYFYDHEIEQWVIAHYGYVGGVGPANDTGIGKMWVYDAADLMKGIQVSKSFGEPSLSQVVRFAIDGEDQKGNAVGIERRSVFENVNATILGEQDIPSAKRSDVRDTSTGSFQLNLGDITESIVEGLQDVTEDLLGGQKRFQINRHNMVDYMEWFTSLIDARWWFEPSNSGPTLVVDATAFKAGAESGQYDRRYFVDDEAVSDWSETQEIARATSIMQQFADGLIELENFDTYSDEDAAPPNSELINLRLANTDNAPSDDTFIERDSFPNNLLPPHNYDIFANVDILQNSALSDIKPFNTLELFGESTTFRERYSGADEETAQDYKEAAAAGGYTEQYPRVTVTYPPLVERAGGYEYSAQPIESDKVYLEEAENQAVKEFRKHLAEETEGEMTLYGEPHIMPYDYIVTLPVCNGTYTNVNAEQLTWEVNSVKHVRKAGDQYKTTLGVSMTIEESLFDIESEYAEA